MTIICWDGTTLAADKLNWTAGTIATICKIRKIRGELYGISGKTVLANIIWKWIENGMKEKEMPTSQQDGEKSVTIMKIDKDRKIWIYEHSITPWHCEDSFFCIGGGCDLGMGAMAAGATAAQAVEIGIKFNALCGKGVDTLTFDQPVVKSKRNKK